MIQILEILGKKSISKSQKLYKNYIIFPSLYKNYIKIEKLYKNYIKSQKLYKNYIKMEVYINFI